MTRYKTEQTLFWVRMA